MGMGVIAALAGRERRLMRLTGLSPGADFNPPKRTTPEFLRTFFTVPVNVVANRLKR